MAQAHSPSRLTGLALPALLARLGLQEPPASTPPFLDGLGAWLGWTDAAPLFAALKAPPSEASSAHAAQAAAQALAEWERVQAQLQGLLAEVPARPTRRGASPQAPAWTELRQRFTGRQQAMAFALAPLRGRLRAALALQPGEACRLAAVDAVMERVLGEREQARLAMLPLQLERLYERALQAQEQCDLAGSDQGRGQGAGAWPEFEKNMQRLLQAEWELRLQPLLGLVAALKATQGNHEQGA